VRTLIGLGLVIAIVAAFAVATVQLPRWRTGEEKVKLVRGVVVPTRAQRAAGPLSLVVELWQGRPRRVRPDETPVDDFGPEPEQGNVFELSAGPDDGPTFFLRAIAELATFERFCARVPLPPVHVVELDGEEVWVDERNGRPLPKVVLAPQRPC
jgi:hypothetical protein